VLDTTGGALTHTRALRTAGALQGVPPSSHSGPCVFCHSALERLYLREVLQHGGEVRAALVLLADHALHLRTAMHKLSES
jgi:hypothetical protein